MSEILQMQFVPILNISDFYTYFDILDVLRNRVSFVRFANGHFRWCGSLNLHHLDVAIAMADDSTVFQMKESADYWSFRGGWGRKLEKTIQYEDIPEYREQMETASAVYQKYSSGLTGSDSRIIMMVIAAVLLAGKGESCLEGICAEQLKAAYYPVEDPLGTEAGEEEKILDIPLNGPSRSIMLHAFRGTYRFWADHTLRPSYEKRMQTYSIRTEADVKIEFWDAVEGRSSCYHLLAGGRIYCLVLEGMVKRILPNFVANGKNTIARKEDGVYVNGKKCPAIPMDASSFAVSAGNIPQCVYVKEGHIFYINYHDFNGRHKVPEEIAVIAEVRIEGRELCVIRNDGKCWDGRKFC